MGQVRTDSCETGCSMDWGSGSPRNPENQHLGLAGTYTGAQLPEAAAPGGQEEGLTDRVMFHVKQSELASATWLDSMFHVERHAQASSANVPHGTLYGLSSALICKDSDDVPRETCCILVLRLLDFRWRGDIWLESSPSQTKKVE